MNIETQFNLIAEQYDQTRKKFIPCFDDYYQGTTKLIVANLTQPKRILDLGAGTGLLSYFWYQQFPASQYVLVDIAEDMLNIARKRFAGLDFISYQILNYTQGLPTADFDVIISALSIHHLEDSEKQELFTRIYHKLPSGGIFVNYDQFCVDSTKLNAWYDTYWQKQLADSGLTANDIVLWQERKKLDRECSVEAEMEMLRNCSFEAVQCIYSYHKFSVLIAIKA